MKHFYESKSDKQTQKIAKQLTNKLVPGDIILLFGNIGAGKTCFVKGIACGLNIDPLIVTSPTFIILNEYKSKISLNHFDFYRMTSFEEIEKIGFFDYIESNAITVIEWPEKVEKYIKERCYKIIIDVVKDNERKINIISPK
ncbi:MAG: tRNA (adenosine(37)-N6)-threonylcarbamoyltransferase complex ATPase subunit type 1 TsaE [Candidatus Firestonebacteria bacterium]|nr:tRNA (adenosine(37)-N6)-threonylcarbamoyltransferase complex ATPase subunit type 1 TsaE [Candidatus Firestonebacteria bacterium]